MGYNYQIINMIAFEKIKKIESGIDNMNLDNLSVVYSIIKKNNENITRKSDCFLINLGSLSSDTVDEILNFIKYLEDNKITLELDENMKLKYKNELDKSSNIHILEQNINSSNYDNNSTNDNNSENEIEITN